jgi:GNAT superfamily N-acetyltransferase
MTTIRPAVPGEYVTVRSVLEAALLEVEAGLLRRSSVLVAVEDGRILGALVLRGAEIEAIAVRPNRRGQGLGSTLVRRAADRRPRVSAGFDPALRPFYASLGFEICCEDGRCRGVRRSVRDVVEGA